MHNIAAALQSLANRLFANAGAEVERCQREVSEAQKRLDDLAAKLKLAKAAVDRRDDFQPLIGSNYQCPYCWINDGTRAPLALIPTRCSNARNATAKSPMRSKHQHYARF